MSTATGGTFIRFRRGTARTSAAHVRYITRERAVLDRDDGVLLHNMPERVYEAPDYDSLRVNLEAHAADREEDEIARHRSGGDPRTHYRVVASFERDVDSEKALGMVRFLGASRPGGISLFRQGLLLWDLLPNMRKDRLEPLMTRFGEILRQHTLFTHILGVL